MCTGGGKRGGRGNRIPKVVLSGGNEKKLHEGRQHKNGGTESFIFLITPPLLSNNQVGVNVTYPPCMVY